MPEITRSGLSGSNSDTANFTESLGVPVVDQAFYITWELFNHDPERLVQVSDSVRWRCAHGREQQHRLHACFLLKAAQLMCECLEH